MIDMEALYNLIENGKDLPSEKELYQLLFKAVVEMEEMDFQAAKDLLNINGSKFLRLKKKMFPKHCNVYNIKSKKRAAQAGQRK